MTDQQRACSVLPDDPYKAITPVLDEFRRDSVTFSRAFCPSPHCCPSRASFMTGLMPTQHGVWHNVNVTNAITRGLKEHVRPWSVDMKEAGYRMLFTGKWHVSNYQAPEDYGWNDGPTEHSIPTPEQQEEAARTCEMKCLRTQAVVDVGPERGRGEILRPGYTPYVHYGSNENPFNDRTVVESALEMLDGLPPVVRSGSGEIPVARSRRERGSGDASLAARVGYTERKSRSVTGPNANAEQPWCMYVGTLGPHDPYIPPERFLDMYDGIEFELPDTFDDPMDDKPALYRRTRDRFNQLSREEHKEAIKHYLAFCSYEDWLFGRVIDKLKERGEYDDTIILYVSDHGDYLGDHGLWCKGLPSFLSNYHVPAILKMPGGDNGVVRDELVSLCDFGPTFMDLAGIESTTTFAGQSLAPLLSSDSAFRTPHSAFRDALFFQTNGNETYGIQRSVVTDKWRFVYNGYDYDELYDLESDPGQMKNLAQDPSCEGIKKDMYRRIWEFGLAHEEQMINEYIMTAMADYGPGIAIEH